MKRTGPGQGQREAVWQRAGGVCEACGIPLTGPGQIHHRRPRRMGGGTWRGVNSPSNLLLLHPTCHVHIESEREWAVSNGYLVHDRVDPVTVPVRRWGEWVYLRPDGSVAQCLNPWEGAST